MQEIEREYKVMTEEREHRIHKKKRKKRALRIYAFLVILLGLAIIGLTVFLLFRVQKIEVKGNEYTSQKEIVKMVQDDEYSTNSLYILGKYLVGRGSVLPCFEDVRISLKAPWTVCVTVEEKPIVGCMKHKKEYLCFDKEGTIVKKGSEKPDDTVLVEGIEAEGSELYDSIKKKKSLIFEEILETSNGLKKYELDVKKIVCKDERIYVYIKKVCVSLGSTVSEEKLAQIPPIMEKIGKKKGTLHLENYSEDRQTITFNKGEFPKEN